MKFKKAKDIVSERLKEEGIRRPKLFLKPGRGDFINRLAYHLVKGTFGILRKEEIAEGIRPGRVIDNSSGVEWLAFSGNVEADAAVVKGEGSIDLSSVKFSFPYFAVDFSLFEKLMPSEQKSLLVQVEIAHSTVKDYFTPENFMLTSVSDRTERTIREFFKGRINVKLYKNFPFSNNVIVLDPSAEKEFTHEEVTPETVIVVGGIVDNSVRLKGSTREILPHFKHRKITYKGVVDAVPDRVNEIVKIVCDYLTSEEKLHSVVRRHMTRDSKLRFLRNYLQNSVQRFLWKGELIRGIPLEEYNHLKEELELSEFFFRKAARHVSGFMVFKPSLLKRVTGETEKRGKKIYILSELKNEDIVLQYP
ncbi:MAG: tRNA (guanine-N1)-methyltransferase [Desulfurobacteriaceae bacterium]